MKRKKLTISDKVAVGLEVALSVLLMAIVGSSWYYTRDLNALAVLVVLAIGCPAEVVTTAGMLESMRG